MLDDLGSSSGLILVIDDEDQVSMLAKLILEEDGFEVMTAASGQQALELFQERSGETNAVLLDMTMPGMSGEEVLAKLVELDPDIPVIISSGYSEDILEEKLKEKKHAGFIQKPYDAMELIRVMRTYQSAG